MSLVGKPFWASLQGKDLATEVIDKVRRYFQASDELGLIQRYREQYDIYFMRDSSKGYSVNGFDATRLDTGNRKDPRVTIRVPEVRSLLRQQQAFALSEPVSFQCVAVSGDQRGVMASEFGEKAVNYVFTERLAPAIPELAETAGAYGAAASHLRWDRTQGDDVMEPKPRVDPMTGQPVIGQDGKPVPEIIATENGPQVVKQPGKSGAPFLDICDPTMFAMDPVLGTKAGWAVAFERTNLHVLAAKFPEQAEMILGLSVHDEFQQYRLCRWSDMKLGADEGDIIVMHWYYADRPELPGGRYALIAGGEVIHTINKCPLPAGRLPVKPLTTAKFTDNALSFCDAFGIGPIEEALNRTRSSELTNYAYYGDQTRWREDSTRIVPGENRSGGVREIVGPRGSQPPKMLEIQPMPSGAEALKRELLECLPRISGFGDVSRGTIDKTTSGAHAAVFEAITARNLSLPQAQLVKHQQELANDMLEMLKQFGNVEFIVELAGKSGQTMARAFTPDDLSSIRRVVAKAVPDAMRGSLARIQLVELTKGIEDPLERAKAVQFILRGDDEYGKNDTRLINLLAIENERLLTGDSPVQAVVTQDHAAHIRDHCAGLDEVMTQDMPDQQAIMRYTAHIKEHTRLIEGQDPLMNQAMGYAPPPLLPGNPMQQFMARQAEAQMMLDSMFPPPLPPDAGGEPPPQ